MRLSPEQAKWRCACPEDCKSLRVRFAAMPGCALDPDNALTRNKDGEVVPFKDCDLADRVRAK